MGNNTLAHSTLVRGAAPQWSTQPQQQHFAADDGGAAGGNSDDGKGGDGGAGSGDSGKGGDSGKDGGGKEFTAITTQEDFDKAIQERIARATKPYSDYDQQKADADKWRKAEDEKKPADQRAAEENERLRQENLTLKAGQLRSDVAADKGVPAVLLTGTTKEELEAAADALLEFRGKVPGGPVVTNENTGNAGANTKSTSKDWLGDALRG